MVRPLALALVLLAATAGGAHAQFVDLGSFRPSAINDDGVMSGMVGSSPAIWADGTATILNPASGYTTASAVDINNSKTVVGTSGSPTDPEAPGQRATVWSGGVVGQTIGTTVDHESANHTTGRAINDAGLVAGTAPYCLDTCAMPRAASGTAGGDMTVLAPFPESGSSVANDVNSSGRIVGTITDFSQSPAVQGWAWNGAGAGSLGSFRPLVINDAGLMAGANGSANSTYLRAPDGTLTPIGVGAADDMNEAGDIVGYTAPATPFKGWVYHQGTRYLLDALVPPGVTGWDLYTASGINEEGVIVGSGVHDGTTKGFMLKPDYPGNRVHGRVTGLDGKGVSGVKFAISGPETLTVTSNVNGEYSADLDPGDYAIVPEVEDGLTTPVACTRHLGGCTFTIDGQDVQIDWRRACAKTLSFGSNFSAVEGCFERLEDPHWRTDQPFRVNGMDMVPSGVVSFNALTETMTGTMTLKVGDVILLENATLDIDFSSPNVALAPNALPVRIKGLPISGGISLATTAGSTTITASVAVPKDLRAGFDIAGGSWKASDPSLDGTYQAAATLVADNDNGPRSLQVMLSPADLLTLQLQPRSGGAASDPNSVKIKSVRAKYDLVQHLWTVGGTMSFPLNVRPGQREEIELEGEGTWSDGWLPIRVAVNLAGINRRVYAALYLQRLGLAVGLSGISKTDPVELEGKVGISLGPKEPLGSPSTKNLGFGAIVVKPSELAGFDGTMKLSDIDKDWRTLTDTVWTGTGTLKIWDYALAAVAATWYIGIGSLEFAGDVNFADPSGQIFVLRGRSKGWWDTDNLRAVLEAKGTVHIKGLIENDAQFVISDTGVAICAGQAGETYGLTYEWETGREKIGGCDLARFRGSPPAARTSHARAAARTPRFALPKGQKLAAVAVEGTTSLTLQGPGVRLKSNPARAVRKGRVRAIPVAHENTTYLIFTRARPGRYAISGAKVKRLRYAPAAPPPQVRGELRGDGCAPTLKFSARKVAGQELRIVDAAAAAHRQLAATGKARGSVKVAAGGAPGPHELLAEVLQGGARRAVVKLATYSPAPGAKLPATGNLRRKRGGVAWDPVCGATGYEVRAGKGRKTIVKTPSLKVKKLRRGVKVSVTTLGAGGRGGTLSARPR